jgi:anti-sigma regulatory factor (Ser/Thr protein kinase)
VIGCSPTEPSAAAAAGLAVRLSVDADPAGVSTASAWIRALAESLDFPADDVYRLDLCLSEIVANIVEHSGVGRRAGRIALEASAPPGAASMSVSVADDGAAFDPLSAPPPAGFADPARIQIGGLGIHLVRSYADDCGYERLAEQNVFRFAIRRATGGAAGAGQPER